MSRSGRIPISIPENTEIKIENNVIFAKGKLGELSYNFKSVGSGFLFTIFILLVRKKLFYNKNLI